MLDLCTYIPIYTHMHIRMHAIRHLHRHCILYTYIVGVTNVRDLRCLQLLRLSVPLLPQVFVHKCCSSAIHPGLSARGQRLPHLPLKHHGKLLNGASFGNRRSLMTSPTPLFSHVLSSSQFLHTVGRPRPHTQTPVSQMKYYRSPPNHQPALHRKLLKWEPPSRNAICQMKQCPREKAAILPARGCLAPGEGGGRYTSRTSVEAGLLLSFFQHGGERAAVLTPSWASHSSSSPLSLFNIIT